MIPIGEEGRLNLYDFVGNSPGNAFDEYGHVGEAVIAKWTIRGAFAVSQADGPEIGPADVVGVGIIGGHLLGNWIAHRLYPDAMSLPASRNCPVIHSAKDSSKNERHGKLTDAAELQRQLAELERELSQTTQRRDKVKIKNKIERIKKKIQQIPKGQEHSRIGKR